MFERGATYTGEFRYVNKDCGSFSKVVITKAEKTKEAVIANLGDWVTTPLGKPEKVTKIRGIEAFAGMWYYIHELAVLTPEEAREHQDKADKADRVAKEQAEIERKQKRKAALNDYTIAELIEAAAEKAKTK